MMYVNKALSKKYGKPLSVSDGEHTKSTLSYPVKNSSIMSNPNTRSDRCGYGVNGYEGKTGAALSGKRSGRMSY